MNEKKSLTPMIILISCAAALCITVYLFPLSVFDDELKNSLVKDVILRSIILVLILGVVFYFDYKDLFTVKKTGKHALLPIISAFAVAIVNFPFYSICSGKAQINDYGFLPLLALYCVLVAFEEEVLFRGLVYDAVKAKVENKNNALILQIVISSAVFALFHLFNILSGSAIGLTLLQVVYTFLLGCLFSIVKEASGNIYFGVVTHAIFNFGGNVIQYAGKGEFFTIYLIVPTIIVGITAGIVCIFTLKKLSKKPNSEIS